MTLKVGRNRGSGPRSVGRRHAHRVLFVTAGLLLGLGVLAGCGAGAGDDVSDQLTTRMLAMAASSQHQADRTVDLRSLTPFRWSRVYAFSSYTNDAAIRRATGLTDVGDTHDLVYGRAIWLLVFVDGKRDVHNVALSEFVIRFRRFPDAGIPTATAKVTFTHGTIVPFAG